MGRYLVIFIFLALVFFGCTTDDGPNLPPFEERVNTAITTLRTDLTSPSLGWRLEYKPTPESGVFFMLLKFTDKDVTIQSDVVANDGFFFEQTIPYRIDNALGDRKSVV